MRTLRRLLAAGALLLAPEASRAVNVPLPVEGATLNITPIVQTQAWLTEAGTPDGLGWATDVFARRTRLLVNGDISDNWSYYLQVDNANFGKFGNYGGRVILQDGFVSWVPTGHAGGTVLFVDAGIMFFPFTRDVFTSIGNKPTVEGHPDLARGFPAATFPGNRSTGVTLRGWAMDKKIGFRGGVYEGQQPTSSAGTPINSKKNPAFAGFLQYNILGTQEGAYVYQSMYFSKVPLLSVSVSGAYQSQALTVPKGVTDQRALSTTDFFEYPFSEDTEVVAMFTGFLYGNGSGSKDTGIGWAGDLGIRYKWIKPYVSFETFTSDDCPTDLVGTALTACLGPTGAHSADMRNFRAGVDIYFNKTQNHLVAEFSVNHGQSSFGPQSITVANAGYAPLSLDPILSGGPRRAIDTTLNSPAFRSVVLNWYASF